MARFLISVWLTPGHMYPAIAVARGLAARGHAVAFHTAPSYGELLRSLGFEFCPIDAAASLEADTVALRDEPAGPVAMKQTFRARFVARVPADVVSLRRATALWRPDVIINDPVSFAPLLVGELENIPVATLNNVVFSWPADDMGPYGLGLPPARTAPRRAYYAGLRTQAEAFYADVVDEINGIRAAYGLAPRRGSLAEATLSPYLHLIPTIPALDYNRADLPPHVHYVGPCLFDALAENDADAAALDWLYERPARQPLALVAASSVFTRSAGMIEAALDGLADVMHDGHPLTVLATLPLDRDLPTAPLAPTMRLTRFVRHSEALPRASVAVTHGGFGMVTKALSYGVPLVIVPYAADQPEVAQRVVETGAGIRLNPDELTPVTLRAAVCAILDDQRYRMAAQRLAAEIAAWDGPSIASILLERLATTRTAVLSHMVYTPELAASRR